MVAHSDWDSSGCNDLSDEEDARSLRLLIVYHMLHQGLSKALSITTIQ